ncbi:MAG: MAPEG family protein [Thermomonas sp.]|nr:MAPEG family protein [Thermomonas sp.]
MLALAVPIARHRHAHKVGLGDGGDKLLARKIRVHGNFTEYVPLALLVLALLEACGLAAAAVWGFGGVLLLGRLLHAAGLSGSGGYSKGRFWGTALTWLSLLLMALAGLWIGLR